MILHPHPSSPPNMPIFATHHPQMRDINIAALPKQDSLHAFNHAVVWCVRIVPWAQPIGRGRTLTPHVSVVAA
jgi:hypothetical protein